MMDNKLVMEAVMASCRDMEGIVKDMAVKADAVYVSPDVRDKDSICMHYICKICFRDLFVMFGIDLNGHRVTFMPEASCQAVKDAHASLVRNNVLMTDETVHGKTFRDNDMHRMARYMIWFVDEVDHVLLSGRYALAF